MSHHEVLHDYVGDVIRHLPHDMRDDVGFELRELLTESLAGRAELEGRAADDAMVLAILREFGSPADVAARYHAPGPILLPATQTRTFLRASLIGMAVQWALTLPAVFTGGSLSAWWLSSGLGALWWPGALIMGASAAAWLRHTGVMHQPWTPRAVDRERVGHRTTVLGLWAFAIGATIVLTLPWLVQLLPSPVGDIFAFSSDFLRERAIAVVPLWVLAFGLRVESLRTGRWSAAMRALDVGVNLAVVALLTWWSLSGPVFRQHSTDAGAKGVFGLVILVILVDLAITFVRRRPPINAPNLSLTL